MEDRPNAGLYRNIQIAFALITVLWLIYAINIVLPADLRCYGLKPRRTDGLPGIVLAPLLHASFRHLTGNSGPLFVLLVVSLTLSRSMTLAALFLITVLGGGGVWLFGTAGTVHVGASGLIFGLLGFTICIGIFQRRWKPLIFSLIVFFAYGGVLMSLFIHMPGVSWSSHFWGFISGVLAAWWLRKADIRHG
ncbi:rhomboid family intramembrane serine protease [Desulfonema ishimotonii]|uniref:Rhomboid family intramembrane serine protease n=1 Tax=Desulfonema ishimotonii TaxID=45657 RepID=A0A401FW09_9BACT|nr:rhomboid family intramembrane serine protease [Desulfonema ishimotonii]GBC61124.1 rhomboid family intramembrane serine protease [Desulfonema ishimotonii]